MAREPHKGRNWGDEEKMKSALHWRRKFQTLIERQNMSIPATNTIFERTA